MSVEKRNKNILIKVLNNTLLAIPICTGVLGILLSIFNQLPLKYLGYDLAPPYPIVIGLISILVFYVGYERIMQRLNTENKLQKLTDDFAALQSDYLNIPHYEIIEGRNNITLNSIKELNNAQCNIRVTSFKGQDNEETPIDYYLALGIQIKLKCDKLIYECCFNEGHNFSERIAAFKKLNFTDKEYDRMNYYKFQNQSYFNFLIIDDNIVFIGFPRHTNDKHMQIALKIKADNNETAKYFIQTLNHWYDNILKMEKEPEVTKELLK